MARHTSELAALGLKHVGNRERGEGVDGNVSFQVDLDRLAGALGRLQGRVARRGIGCPREHVRLRDLRHALQRQGGGSYGGVIRCISVAFADLDLEVVPHCAEVLLVSKHEKKRIASTPPFSRCFALPK